MGANGTEKGGSITTIVQTEAKQKGKRETSPSEESNKSFLEAQITMQFTSLKRRCIAEQRRWSGLFRLCLSIARCNVP
jgi:hypothetical protein